MKRAPGNKLYSLVGALTKNEKRNITLYLSNECNHAQNSLRLFNEICENKIEEDVSRFEKSITWTNNLPKLKYDLYYLILNQLAHQENSKEALLKSKIQQIQILFFKGMYDEAIREWKAALKQAQELEEFLLLQELYRIRLMMSVTVPSEDLSEIDHLTGVATENLDRYQVNMKAYALTSKITNLLRFDSGKKKEEQLLEQLIIQLEKLHAYGYFSKHMKLNYYYAIMTYCEKIGDYSKMFTVAKKNYDLFVANEDFKKKKLGLYISALSNYAYTCIYVLNFSAAEAAIEKLKLTPAKLIADKRFVFQQYSMLKLRLLLNSGQLNKAMGLEKEILAGVKKYENLLPESYKKTVNLEFAGLMLYKKREKDALKYINKAMESTKSNERSLLNPIIRMTNIIIHHELGNDYLVENLILSYKRAIKKKAKLTLIEAWISSFLNELLKTNASTNCYQKYLLSLQNLLTDVKHEHIILHFNIEAWLMYKLGQGEIENLLQNSFKRSNQLIKVSA